MGRPWLAGDLEAAASSRLYDRRRDAAGLLQVLVVAFAPRRSASLWRRVAGVQDRLADDEDEILVLPGVHAGEHRAENIWRTVSMLTHRAALCVALLALGQVARADVTGPAI
jgi:hypothetical protein